MKTSTLLLLRTADPNQLIMMVAVLVDFLGQAAHMRWWGGSCFWGGVGGQCNKEVQNREKYDIT